jgi:hypothetical protein
MAVSTPIASVSDVRAFIDEYFEAWSGTDENLILSYYSENVSLELPGTVINGKAPSETSLSAHSSLVFPVTATL